MKKKTTTTKVRKRIHFIFKLNILISVSFSLHFPLLKTIFYAREKKKTRTKKQNTFVETPSVLNFILNNEDINFVKVFKSGV